VFGFKRESRKKEENMDRKIVTSCSSKSFEVDISDEACGKFGFKHGDRIVDNNNNEKGTIMGVAGMVCGEGKETLWYALDCDGGRVSFSEPFEKGALTLLPA
jgi:hypothetical protein